MSDAIDINAFGDAIRDIRQALIDQAKHNHFYDVICKENYVQEIEKLKEQGFLASEAADIILYHFNAFRNAAAVLKVAYDAIQKYQNEVFSAFKKETLVELIILRGATIERVRVCGLKAGEAWDEEKYIDSFLSEYLQNHTTDQVTLEQYTCYGLNNDNRNLMEHGAWTIESGKRVPVN